MSTADPDDDKTITGPPMPGGRRPGASGEDAVTGLQAERRRARAAAPMQPGHTLPVGTRVRDYEVTGLIGEGGFGIVYLAWDHSLQRRVAVKEYMPASMAARVNGSSAIVVKSERHLDTFRAGLKSFVNEARLLARFDHPSLVKVYRFWEENGTAYMVMPYYEGPTLKSALAELGRAPSEAELRAWLRPLLDALAVMHAAQCYHRDIAPDNILLTPRGPLLLDFGAARRVIGDMTHAITVVLKPGYAPIEQYGDVATMTQGAWTDLYALASVVYYAIVGRTPTSSVERLMDDRLEPLAVTAAGRYGAAFLRAIDAALAVRPGDRPQTEREFRALLDAGQAATPPVPPAPAPPPRLAAMPAAAPSGDDDWAPPYRTVPGTLTPELATQPGPRPPSSSAGETSAPQALPPGSGPGPTADSVLDLEVPPEFEAPAPPGEPPAQEDVAPLDPPPPLFDFARVAAQEAAAPAPPPAAPRAARRPVPIAVIGVGVFVVALLAAAVVRLQLRGAGDPPSAAPAPAATSAASTAAVLPAATPAASTVAAPSAAAPGAANASAPSAAMPEASGALPASAPPSSSPEVAPHDPTDTSTRAAPSLPAIDGKNDERDASAVPAARTPRPRRDAPARVETTPTVKAPAPRPAAAASSRCSDILQKASLEPLSAAEAAYLKRECR